MKKILFLFAFGILFSFTKVDAQDLTVQWQNFYGANTIDFAYAMELTSDGGVVMAGESHSLVVSPQARVFKIDSSGELQWQKSYGGEGTEVFKSIKQTPDGGFIMVGNIQTVNTAGQDAWILKINASGDVEWSKSYYNFGLGELTSVIVAADGNYLALGRESNDNNGDFIIRKIDALGNDIWTHSYGGSAAEYPNAMVQTSEGGYIVVGSTNSVDGDVVGNNGGSDYWIIKLNENGIMQWQRTLGGTNFEAAQSVIQSSDGGYVIAGYSDSNNGYLTGSTDYPGDQKYNYWVVKLDGIGDIQWQKSIGDPTWDQKGYSVIQTLDGGYVVAGETNQGNQNAFVIKLTSSGVIESELDYSSTPFNTSGDNVRSIRQTSEGKYFLGGYSGNGNNQNLPSGHQGLYDFWLVKISGESISETEIPDDNFEAYLEANDMGNDIAGDNLVYTSNIENITFLDISNKSIQDLTGIEGFTALQAINCSSNQLATVDLSMNINLNNLDISNNQLTSIDLSENLNLAYLTIRNNQLMQIDLSENFALSSLSCDNNQLTELTIGDNLNLSYLDCSMNQIEEMVFSSNALLSTIICTDNQLTTINVEDNPNLNYLNFSNNQISQIDISSNAFLNTLVCSNNLLNELNIEANLNLFMLDCAFNQISELDLSSHTILFQVKCNDNNLIVLNLKNGNNGSIFSMYAQNNTDLECIQVDDENYESYIDWQKDDSASYSEICNYPIIWRLNNQWSNVTGPSIDDDIAIVGELILNDDLSAKNIRIVSTGIFKITENKTVTLSGGVVNKHEANRFLIKNGGNLLQTDENVVNTGNVSVHRYSQPMFRLDYTLWSSPVTSQNLFGFSPITINGVTNHVGSTGRIYVYNGINAYVNPNPFTAESVMETGRGYLFRAPNNFSAEVAVPYVGEFVGKPFNGDVNVSTFAESFTSIGNPYPSSINANDLMIGNPGISALYFWNNTGVPGANYATYTLLGGTAAGGGSNIPNEVISVGQGFIVATNDNAVHFENNMRSFNNGNFFRTSENEKHRIWLNLDNSEGINYNQILIGYFSDATNGIDHKIDGKLFNYQGSALYNIINQQKFVIQGRELPFVETDVVLLGFKALTEGQYTISLSNYDGIFQEEGMAVYLKDNNMNLIHNLFESDYTFESLAGEFNERFEIVYEIESTLGINHYASNEILIYKNQDSIEIKTEFSPIVNVEVFDLQGRKIYSKDNINESFHKIKLHSKGVLIIKVQTENGNIQVKKIINL